MKTAKSSWKKTIVVAFIYAIGATYGLLSLDLPIAAVVKVVILSTILVIGVSKVMDIG